MSIQYEAREPTILYIEDDAVTREQFSQFLQPQCKSLYVAHDGQQGFELYKQHKPDIVITDIEMPKVSGLELARKIRSDSLTTQIIIITAYKKPEYLLEAVNLQLVQYLVKPISLAKITSVLDLALSLVDKDAYTTHKKISESNYYDTYTKEMVGENGIINLSKYERGLVELLIRKYPAPASYESIDAHIYDNSASKNAMKLLVSSLREKINKASILNVSGFGYKIILMEN